jgi:iron complex outermembrane recepter protein
MRARNFGVLAAVALPVFFLPFGNVSLADDSDASPPVDVNGIGEANSLDQVVVTGTHGEGRTLAASASPVDVISGNEIQQSGATNLVDALNRLVPSLNLPAENNPDLGSIIRGAQLRNLDPSYTLVLINGKRRHITSYVGAGFPGSIATDLSLIPIASIDHIEVLRDGASAVYGSDAIAGVVNIILKSGPSGGDYAAQWGKTYAGDGDTSSLRASQGLPLGTNGYVDLSVEADKQDQVVRNFPLHSSYLLYPAISPAGALVGKLGSNNSLPAGDTPNPAEALRYNEPWHNVGAPATSSLATAINADLPINELIDLYAFGTFTHRVAFAAENFRTPDAVYSNDPSALSIYPNGFTPFENINEKDYQFDIGIRGALLGWKYDLSSGLGRDDQDVYTRHTLNYSLPYPKSPTNFYDGAQIYDDWTSNLDLSRSFDIGLLPKPLQTSWGVEARHEKNSVTAGEPLSYFGSGASSLLGNLPQNDVNATRTSESLYAELSTNLTNNWFVDLAGRGEHYSDFGYTKTGKFATRYDVTDRIGLRGTVSSGFHAPALATESYTYKLDMNGTTSYTLVPSSASARALGATPLQPERSVNYTFGVTFEPLQGLHAAIDLYRINISNRLGSSATIGYNSSTGEDNTGRVLTPAQVASTLAALQSAGLSTAGALNAAYFTSIGDTRTDGIDFTLEGRAPVPVGAFNWNFAANYNHNELTRIAATPGVLAGLPDITTLSKAAEYVLLYEAPPDKEILNLSYALGSWSTYVRENRYGKITRLNSTTGDNYYEAAVFTTDVGLTYAFTKQLSLTATAVNAFNKFPSTVPYAAQSASTRAQYTNAWDASTPVGLLGGQYFVKAELRY